VQRAKEELSSRDHPKALQRDRSSTPSLTRESNSTVYIDKKRNSSQRGWEEEGREEEETARKTASGRSWPKLFSWNVRNDLSLTISLYGGGSRARRPARGNSYVIVYDKYEKEEPAALLGTLTAEDSSPFRLAPRNANHRHHRRGRSATDSNATASRRRPRAIELCIMPNALAKQYDRLEWRGGGCGRPRGRWGAGRTIGGGSRW